MQYVRVDDNPQNSSRGKRHWLWQLQIVYVLFCLYLWVALAVKTSLTVFIMRIFPTVTIRRIGIGMIIFMAIVTISGELPLILQCKPVRAAYDKTIEDFDCFSDLELKNIQLYQAILMFIIDVIIIVLPMPTIWKLQMPIQRRLIVIGLFALGTSNFRITPLFVFFPSFVFISPTAGPDRVVRN